MKLFFCALLIMNVAVLLWPAGEKRNFNNLFKGGTADSPHGFGGSVAGDPAVNPKDLILLSEKIAVQADDSLQQTEAVAAVEPTENSQSQQAADQAPDNPTDEQQASTSQAESRHCLRIGPFFEENQKAVARDFVASFEVPVGTQVVDGRIVRSWRAFLGPFETKAQLRDAHSRAVQAGFGKSRALQQTDAAEIVSLGLFSTEKSAERVLSKTRFSTLKVNIREERTRLPSTSWLEVPDPGVTIHELRMIDRTDWGERQVNVREIVCAG